MDTVKQISNFVLNISNWEIINHGTLLHKVSMHIQDIIPNFVIEWLITYNGDLYFEGEYIDNDGRFIKTGYICPNDLSKTQLNKILKILKSVNLFE